MGEVSRQACGLRSPEAVEKASFSDFVILNAVKNLDGYQWFPDPSHSLRMTNMILFRQSACGLRSPFFIYPVSRF
jgi:hypothetical protein